MTTPLSVQTSFFAQSGQLGLYRSGTHGRVRNEGDVRNINGYAVDLTGSAATVVSTQTFTAGKGVQTARSVSASPLSPSTLAASLQLQEAAQFPQTDRQAVRNMDSSAFVAAVPETVEVHHTPIGAELQPVEGLGFIPGDVFQSGREIDYIKGQIARAGELARVENQLRSTYGADVKLAFDPMAEEYVMLRPGQTGYDRMPSADDVFVQVVRDIGKMGGNRDAYQDVLARYGAG